MKTMVSAIQRARVMGNEARVALGARTPSDAMPREDNMQAVYR